jgi:hypothetical protein
MCVNFRNGKIEFGDVAKWPKGSPAYRTAEWACVGADQVSQRRSDDVEFHLDSAMKDQCK